MYEYIIGSGSQDGRILFKKIKVKNIIKISRNKLTINNKEYVFNYQNYNSYINLFRKYKPKKIYYFFTFHLSGINKNKKKISILINILNITFLFLKQY